MLKLIFSALLVVIPLEAFSQSFFPIDPIQRLVPYHSTVSTSTALAIPSVSVGANLDSFKICNDAVNTSTYLLVGQAADVATDGVMLDKGQCFECPGCKASVLKAMKIKAQAASNGYSVIQYRK